MTPYLLDGLRPFSHSPASGIAGAISQPPTRWEFWLSIVCFIGVAVLGAIPGIGLAIVIAVIEFLWDGWRPHSAVLGRADDIKGYHDITRYPDARLIPGLVMFRWDAPCFLPTPSCSRIGSSMRWRRRRRRCAGLLSRRSR